MLSPREISSALYDDFVLYTKYASAAYSSFAQAPLAARSFALSFPLGSTQGFIPRDYNREEIVVVFRGTFSLKDAVIGTRPRPPRPVRLPRHHLSIVKAERINYPTYRIVITGIHPPPLLSRAPDPNSVHALTGHSLGGAIASLAAPSLKIALPETTHHVGDAKFARFAEDTIGGENIFRNASSTLTYRTHVLIFPPPAQRCTPSASRALLLVIVHGVPTMVPRIWKYEHFNTPSLNPQFLLAEIRREHLLNKDEKKSDDGHAHASQRDARAINSKDEQSSDELPYGNKSLFDVEPDFDEEDSLDLDFILRPISPDAPDTSTMAGVNAQAPAGTGVASFKVPRPWESNVPKFTTEDKEDLQDFMEQVDDIIGLGQITDDDEKKRLLTSYLPAKKREIIRETPPRNFLQLCQKMPQNIYSSFN
ncbi:hypothetical protein B0H11DRAFT_2397669 [Mycena galericulata]|nr:hypothetical protein B0H11DRAFT_2397669 [Mycena galericulata]